MSYKRTGQNQRQVTENLVRKENIVPGETPLLNSKTRKLANSLGLNSTREPFKQVTDFSNVEKKNKKKLNLQKQTRTQPKFKQNSAQLNSQLINNESQYKHNLVKDSEKGTLESERQDQSQKQFTQVFSFQKFENQQDALQSSQNAEECVEEVRTLQNQPHKLNGLTQMSEELSYFAQKDKEEESFSELTQDSSFQRRQQMIKEKQERLKKLEQLVIFGEQKNVSVVQTENQTCYNNQKFNYASLIQRRQSMEQFKQQMQTRSIQSIGSPQKNTASQINHSFENLQNQTQFHIKSQDSKKNFRETMRNIHPQTQNFFTFQEKSDSVTTFGVTHNRISSGVLSPTSIQTARVQKPSIVSSNLMSNRSDIQDRQPQFHEQAIGHALLSFQDSNQKNQDHMLSFQSNNNNLNRAHHLLSLSSASSNTNVSKVSKARYREGLDPITKYFKKAYDRVSQVSGKKKKRRAVKADLTKPILQKRKYSKKLKLEKQFDGYQHKINKEIVGSVGDDEFSNEFQSFYGNQDLSSDLGKDQMQPFTSARVSMTNNKIINKPNNKRYDVIEKKAKQQIRRSLQSISQIKNYSRIKNQMNRSLEFKNSFRGSHNINTIETEPERHQFIQSSTIETDNFTGVFAKKDQSFFIKEIQKYDFTTIQPELNERLCTEKNSARKKQKTKPKTTIKQSSVQKNIQVNKNIVRSLSNDCSNPSISEMKNSEMVNKQFNFGNQSLIQKCKTRIKQIKSTLTSQKLQKISPSIKQTNQSSQSIQSTIRKQTLPQKQFQKRQVRIKSPSLRQIDISHSQILDDKVKHIKTEESSKLSSSKFVDETDPSERTERELQEISNLRAQCEIVGIKVEYYSKLVDLDQILEFSTSCKVPQSAVIKAMRSLCLLLKSMTQMSTQFKQIKDDELFAQWDRIKQYLNSDQGSKQISLLPKVKNFCDQFNHLVDKRTLKILRREIFGYTMISPEKQSAYSERDYEIDVESPRVKNLHVKQYFCLTYFVMLYVALVDEIEVKKSKVENQITLIHEQLSSKMTEHYSSNSFNQLKQQDSYSERQISPNFKSIEEAQFVELEDRPLQLTQNAQESNINSNDEPNNLDWEHQTNFLPEPICLKKFNSKASCKKSENSEFKEGCNVEHNGNFEMFSSKAKISVADSVEKKPSVMISSIKDFHHFDSTFMPQDSQEKITSSSINQLTHLRRKYKLSKEERPNSALETKIDSVGSDLKMLFRPITSLSRGGQIGNGLVADDQEFFLRELSNGFLSGENQENLSASQSLTSNSKLGQSYHSRQTAQLGILNSDFTFFQSMRYHNNSSNSAQKLLKTIENRAETCENTFTTSVQSPSTKISEFLSTQRAQHGTAQIKVDDLIKKVKNEITEEKSDREKQTNQDEAAIEKAFLEFYQIKSNKNSNAIFSPVQETTESQEVLLTTKMHLITSETQMKEGELSNDFQPVISAAMNLAHQTQITQDSQNMIDFNEELNDKNAYLRTKLGRTSSQIINSIKKRRARSHERVTGQNLELLADNIIEQCRLAIQKIERSETPLTVEEAPIQSNEFETKHSQKQNNCFQYEKNITATPESKNSARKMDHVQDEANQYEMQDDDWLENAKREKPEPLLIDQIYSFQLLKDDNENTYCENSDQEKITDSVQITADIEPISKLFDDSHNQTDMQFTLLLNTDVDVSLNA